MTTQFLWEGARRPDPSEFHPRRLDWWQQYAKNLRIGRVATDVLYDSCRSLLALLPDPSNWGDSDRPFRGLVVGAVQSGKTASMIGLTAMALDQGYRIVIVLSGNKDDLRRQTARRFNVQLLRRSDPIANSGGARTLPVETARNALPAFCLPYDRDAHQYAAFHNLLEAELERGHPAVIVIKKHLASLADVRRKLAIAYERNGVSSLPTLILDDECDDASVEREEMPIPAAIAGLWRRAGDHPLAAYAGYTATSAANLLQHRDNELFPRNFVYLLRYPAGEESALSYSEPRPGAWYVGGETYYGAFGDEPGPRDNFLVVPNVELAHVAGPVSANPSLPYALRSFIVSGAYRLALQHGWSLDDPAHFPSPHTMLVQTSSSQWDHRLWLEGIVGFFGGRAVDDGAAYSWSSESVLSDLAANEPAWRGWYDEFTMTRTRILEERPRTSSGGIANWEQVRESIEPFIRHLRIKVVNSDEEVGSDLDFAPRVGRSGIARRAQDIFVIVIGGAKLSRGLTVEGLCTTYFVRWTAAPTEDTILQLSRWYGYRGEYLEFCRLFTTTEIYSQLESIDGNDRELRYELALLMREGRSPADAALVIGANPRALPSGKMGEGRVYDLCFSPYSTVLRRVETRAPALQSSNQEHALDVVNRVKTRKAIRVVAASGAVRGTLSCGWEAGEIAAVLDMLEFADHNPSAASNPAREYYRRPDAARPIVRGRSVLDDPYQIAAYLRQWAAQGDAPMFNIGLAHGEMTTETEPFTFPLINREITTAGEVVGGWSGRRAGWPGDQQFDDRDGAYAVAGTLERRRGAPGLLLLYVVHRLAQGRYGRGIQRAFHTPVVGIVIPDGGPTWRRVTVDRRRLVDE